MVLVIQTISENEYMKNLLNVIDKQEVFIHLKRGEHIDGDLSWCQTQ